MMKQRETMGGLFWLTAGLGLSAWTATSYEIGSLTQPGPGYLPLALGILLILLSGIVLFGQWRRSSPPAAAAEGGQAAAGSGGGKRVAYTVLVLLAAAFAFEPVGYLLTLFCLIVLLMKGAAEQQSWKRILLTAALTTLGVYLIFVRLLQQELPRGFLGV